MSSPVIDHTSKIVSQVAGALAIALVAAGASFYGASLQDQVRQEANTDAIKRLTEVSDRLVLQFTKLESEVFSLNTTVRQGTQDRFTSKDAQAEFSIVRLERHSKELELRAELLERTAALEIRIQKLEDQVKVRE